MSVSQPCIYNSADNRQHAAVRKSPPPMVDGIQRYIALEVTTVK